VVEVADQEHLFASPRHPYTRALIDAVPIPDPRAERARATTVLEGEVPSALDPPTGCVFRTRCVHAADICTQAAPTLEILGNSTVACHRAGDLAAG
jgi:oligopeptide transport system ATP-binding protein